MYCMTNKKLSASVLIAGAATIASLALFGAASPSTAEAAPASVSGHIIPVNDDDGWSVNDQGQTSGDTFIQNAQDQSTA
jgi:hypothetical protein